MKKFNKRNMVVISLLVALLLMSLACNLLTPREAEVVVEEVEEVEVVAPEEPEDEDIYQPELLFRLEPLMDDDWGVYSVAISNNGELLGTGTFTQADIWSAMDGSHVQSLEASHSVEAMAFTADDQSIVLSVNIRAAQLYSLSDGEMVLDYDDSGFDPSMAMSQDGEIIISGMRGSVVTLLQTVDGEVLLNIDPADYLEDYSEWVTSVAISPGNELIAAGYWDGMIFLWNTADAALVRIIEPETEYCSASGLDFSLDGHYLAVGGAQQEWDEVIKIYDLTDGSTAYVLEEFSRGGSMTAPVVFSPDGSLFAAGATDGIYIWSLPDFVFLHYLSVEDLDASDWVTDLAFSPNSRYLLAGYWNGYAHYWQVQE